MAAFQRAYPHARAVRWTWESGQFEAEFHDGVSERKTWLMLTSAGEITETEVEIEPAQLPAPVRSHLGTKYSGYRVTQAAVIRPNMGGLIYEAEMKQGTTLREVYLRADGVEVKLPKPRKQPVRGHDHYWPVEPVSQYPF